MPNLGCKLGTAYQRQLGELATALADAGLELTTSEYLLLRALYDTDGMQQCDIASLLSKDKAAVSRCVASLIRKGYIATRSESYKCQRAYLTATGRALQSDVMAVARERQAAIEQTLTETELQVLNTILDKIINH